MSKTPNPAQMMCNSARSTVEWVERPTPPHSTAKKPSGHSTPVGVRLGAEAGRVGRRTALAVSARGTGAAAGCSIRDQPQPPTCEAGARTAAPAQEAGSSTAQREKRQETVRISVLDSDVWAFLPPNLL